MNYVRSRSVPIRDEIPNNLENKENISTLQNTSDQRLRRRMPQSVLHRPSVQSMTPFPTQESLRTLLSTVDQNVTANTTSPLKPGAIPFDFAADQQIIYIILFTM